MVEDQRFVAGRPDVLVYERTFAEDLTIAGQIEVSVNVATDGTDGDWVVR
jgi:predicted acyl esterase